MNGTNGKQEHENKWQDDATDRHIARRPKLVATMGKDAYPLRFGIEYYKLETSGFPEASFSTAMFKNSHYNKAHYSNPHFHLDWMLD